MSKDAEKAEVKNTHEVTQAPEPITPLTGNDPGYIILKEPDWSHWNDRGTWSLTEGICLLAKIDPAQAGQRRRFPPSHKDLYDKYMGLAEADTAGGILEDLGYPVDVFRREDFLTWAKSKKSIDIPEELSPTKSETTDIAPITGRQIQKDRTSSFKAALQKDADEIAAEWTRNGRRFTKANIADELAKRGNYHGRSAATLERNFHLPRNI